MGRRSRGVAGLSLAASAGLLGTYVGYPGLRKAHAATTCEVESTNDAGAGSLRQCLADIDTAGGGTITFADSANGTINLTSGDLPTVTLMSSITITGNGEGKTVIDGGAAHGGLDFTGSGTVTVTGLTIRNTSRNEGGALFSNAGDVSVQDSTFASNVATNRKGGAINSYEGDLSIQRSTFTGNKAEGKYGDGGALYTYTGAVSIVDSTFTGNKAYGSDGFAGSGGALYTFSGLVSVANSTFTSNKVYGQYGTGGAIHTSISPVSVEASTFSSNSATDDGGAIRTSSGAVSVEASTFSSNSATDDGGAIRTSSSQVTVSASTFSGNSAADDGGAIRTSGGAVSVVGSDLTSNTAANDGGAIRSSGGAVTVSTSTISENVATSGDGGAVRAFSGTVAVTRSTFASNQAGDDGGAIYGYSSGSVVNATFTGNSSGDDGGAIYLYAKDAALELSFVTVTQNTTGSGNGAVHAGLLNGAEVGNSIIHGNTGGDVYVVASGTLSASYSLFTSTSSVSPSVSGSSLIVGEDPLLGSLADNGGSTLTMMPGAGSPVLGAANPSGAPATDQRGFTRTTDGLADMGAVQRAAQAPEPDLSQVPPSWHQAQGRQQREAVCPPGMAPSWAQWPNEGTGGWTCEYTTWWDVDEGVGGGWVTTPGLRAGSMPGR